MVIRREAKRDVFCLWGTARLIRRKVVFHWTSEDKLGAVERKCIVTGYLREL